MATPTLQQFLAYGPGAFEAAAMDERRLGALQEARRLTELRDVALADPNPQVGSGPGGMTLQGLAPPAFNDSTNQFDLNVALKQAGLDPSAFASSRATNALADQRDAQTEKERIRLRALEDVLDDPTLNDAVKADIANQRAVSKPQRVKVRRQGGEEVYMNAQPNLAGGWDYTPAEHAGQPLRVPASTTNDRPTALQRDTAFIAQTLGIPDQQAIKFKLQSRQKSDSALWDDIVLRVRSADKYADAQEVKAQAEDLWRTMRPGRDLPTVQASSPAPQPAPAKTDGKEDARQRAASEGYTIIGPWTEGKGWRVQDKSGRRGWFN